MATGVLLLPLVQLLLSATVFPSSSAVLRESCSPPFPWGTLSECLFVFFECVLVGEKQTKDEFCLAEPKKWRASERLIELERVISEHSVLRCVSFRRTIRELPVIQNNHHSLTAAQYRTG